MQKEPKKFADLGIKVEGKVFVGEKIKIYTIFNTEILVHHYEINLSKYPKKENDQCLQLQISVGGVMQISFTGSKNLINMIKQVPEYDFPFSTKIVSNNKRYEFT